MNDPDRREDTVRLRAGGVEAEFRGRHLPNLIRFLIFLLLALLFALVYQGIQSSQNEHAGLKAAIAEQTDAQREQTYVLTLTQAQREALNLSMPDSLRRRLRMGIQ